MSQKEGRRLMQGSHAGRELLAPDVKYCSKLAQWDRVAAVRAKPRRALRQEIGAGALVFPESLLPLLRTRIVSGLAPDNLPAIRRKP